jgi:hypothetical protein
MHACVFRTIHINIIVVAVVAAAVGADRMNDTAARHEKEHSFSLLCVLLRPFDNACARLPVFFYEMNFVQRRHLRGEQTCLLSSECDAAVATAVEGAFIVGTADAGDTADIDADAFRRSLPSHAQRAVDAFSCQRRQRQRHCLLHAPLQK